MSVWKTISTIIFMAVLVGACASKNDNLSKPFAPRVVDSAGILKKGYAKKAEQAYSFPADSPVLVRTIQRLKPSHAAALAGEMMDKEEYWKSVRPKNFWERIAGDTPQSTGTYILISKSPRIIQIRFGERIRLQAYRAGLAVGDHYLAIQNGYLSGTLSADAALTQTLAWMSASMRDGFELPWYLSRLIGATGAIEMFKEFSVPQEGFYKKYVFAPFASLSIPIVETIGDRNSLPLINAAIYWVLRLVLVSLVLNLALRMFLPKSRYNIISIITPLAVFLFSILFAFPSLGLTLLMSQARLEDKFVLEALGLSVPSFAKVPSEYFAVNSGYWLAGATTLLLFLKTNISNLNTYYFAMLLPEKQRTLFAAVKDTYWGMLVSGVVPASTFSDQKMMDEIPYRAISHYMVGESLKSTAKWFAFLLFMPAAIAIYCAAIFFVPLLIGLFKTPFVISRARKQVASV